MPYGGVEPYVVAPFVWLFGPSSATLQAAPIVLAAVASLLTWRVARRLVSPGLAVIAGAISWVFPAIDVGVASTLDPEFRGVTLVCGLACLVLGFRLLDDPKWGLSQVTLFGVLAGVGWWSSPEIVYFLLPAALALLAVFVRRSGAGWRIFAPGLTLLAAGRRCTAVARDERQNELGIASNQQLPRRLVFAICGLQLTASRLFRVRASHPTELARHVHRTVVSRNNRAGSCGSRICRSNRGYCGCACFGGHGGP